MHTHTHAVSDIFTLPLTHGHQNSLILALYHPGPHPFTQIHPFAHLTHTLTKTVTQAHTHIIKRKQTIFFSNTHFTPDHPPTTSFDQVH